MWTEENDPTPYYYSGIFSHMDHDLLNHQVRKKKVLGLFLLLIVINFLNLIFPE